MYKPWQTIVQLLLICCTAVAAERPATAPTTRPGNLATIAPDAAELVKQVGEAYAKLDSLHISGRSTLSLQESGQERTHETTFTSAFEAPNRFRHEVKDSSILGSTGRKIYAMLPPDGVYVQQDTEGGKVDLAEVPSAIRTVLVRQNPSLALAISHDPVAELRSWAREIDRGTGTEVDGKKFAVLSLKGQNGSTLLLIDLQTHLIRRATTDLAFAFKARPDIASPQFVVDYEKIDVGAQIDHEQFAWTPPPGFRDLTRADASDDEGGDSPAAALVGQPAPDFSLEDLDGKTVRLSDLKGSVVVLDFWATWCGPCVMSMPHLERIYQDHARSGLKMFAVNLREDKDKITPFMQAHKLTMPVLLDSTGAVARKYSANAIPQTVIIGADGVVRKVVVGFNPRGADELAEFIKGLMAAAAQPAE